MKLFSQVFIFLVAISLAMSSLIAAKDSDTEKENKNNSAAKSIAKGIVRFPCEIGKNIAGGLTVVGIGITATLAYLWLVKNVNAGGLNTLYLNGTEKYLESLSNPGPREQIEWLKIQLYKNIDIATLASGASTVATGFVYLLFKSCVDTLK